MHTTWHCTCTSPCRDMGASATAQVAHIRELQHTHTQTHTRRLFSSCRCGRLRRAWREQRAHSKGIASG